MWGSLLRFLIGFERIKERGDRFFLEGDFHRARRHYQKARAVLPELDYRIPTLDALIRECAVRTGASQSSLHSTAASPTPDVTPVRDGEHAVGRDGGDGGKDEPPFVPEMKDLLELAIAEKTPTRAALYSGQSPEFDSGYVALVQGDAARAVERLRLARGKAEASFVVRLELGRALAMAGDMSGARSELQKAVQLLPADVEALTLLAAVHLQLHEYSEAERILLPLADGPDQEGVGAEPSFLLGRSLARQGRRREALERLRNAVERDGSFHDAYFEAGKLLREEKDDRGALRLLVQACSMVPDEVDYNRELATLVLDRGLDVETGLAACDRLMVTDEDNRWEYLGWIAELYIRRGWKREAVDPLRKAIELVPAGRTHEKVRLQERLVELTELETGGGPGNEHP